MAKITAPTVISTVVSMDTSLTLPTVNRASATPHAALVVAAAIAGDSITIDYRVNEFNVAAAIIATSDIIGLLQRYTGLPPQFRDHVVLHRIENLTLALHIDALSRPDAGRQSQRAGDAYAHPAGCMRVSQRASAFPMVSVALRDGSADDGTTHFRAGL